MFGIGKGGMKMGGSKRAICSGVCFLALLVSGCTHQAPSNEKILANPSSGQSIGRDEIRGEFPALWIERLAQALELFRKEGENPECFTVVTYTNNDRNYVRFIPARNEVREEDGVVTVPAGGRTDCGREISFIFDKQGNFVRHYYPR